MRLSTEWISEGANASAEERATLCNLQIFVDGENACLHFDPDLQDDIDARVIEDAGDLFSEEALVEPLAGISKQSRERARQLLEWVRHAEDRPRDESRLPDLGDIAEQIRRQVQWSSQERSWAAGYRAARALRADNHGVAGRAMTSSEVIAKKPGAENFATTAAVPGVFALVAREEQEVHELIEDYPAASDCV